MGKLGKKARKFAKKHLQSVLRRRRKMKSMRDSFKKKKNSQTEEDSDKEQVKAMVNDAGQGFRKLEDALLNGILGDASLDVLFSDDDNDLMEEDSGSDGFLSEDSNCPYIADSENKSEPDDKSDSDALLGQNEGLLSELTKQKRKLQKLKEKDPEFSKFLEREAMDIVHFKSKEYSDEEGEMSDHDEDVTNDLDFHGGRILTLATVESWCQLVVEKRSLPLLSNLLNAYRAACHFGAGNDMDEVPCWKIEDKEVFSKILTFMLHEGIGIFQKVLGISNSSWKKEYVMEQKNTDKWKTMKPLIKSYLRSSLYLLDQVTDHQILEFTLSRVRVLIIFFSAFPTLLQRLIKVTVHLWATGGGALSSLSFFVIRDMAIQLNTECFNACLKKTYRAFVAHCVISESENLKRIQFLRDCVVELYSQDMQKGFQKAIISVQQLAKILQLAIKTKKKEWLNKIYNSQYTTCVDLWVNFISTNIRDHDLQKLLYLVIQLINGIAHLFPGPRYLPLRVKYIQMLNHLSVSGGIFIPVASLALSSLDHCENNKGNAAPRKPLNLSCLSKVPKWFLKSRDFQEECVLSAIKLLSAHFAQWSYHISFPELATIPLICLRKFHEKTTIESFRRLIKRFIDHVEQNVEFVQRKRDEVTYSPKDLESVETFLVIEKTGSNAPFMQYYTSILEKFNSKSVLMNEKISKLEQRRPGKRKHQVCDRVEDMKADGERALGRKLVNSTVSESKSNKRRKKKPRS